MSAAIQCSKLKSEIGELLIDIQLTKAMEDVSIFLEQEGWSENTLFVQNCTYGYSIFRIAIYRKIVKQHTFKDIAQ